MLRSYLKIASMVGFATWAVLFTANLRAESLPLFFKTHYGDARDTIAVQPRKFQADDPTWQPRLSHRGQRSGQTVVTLHFPTSAKSFPIRFGIPLGQVPSADNVVVLDEQGRPLRADVFALVNFTSAPQHWVLIAAVIDAPQGGSRELTIRWGPHVKRSLPAKAIAVTADENGMHVSGPKVRFTVSAKSLLTRMGSAGGEPEFALRGSRVAIKHDGTVHTHNPGSITKLYDGPIYKRFRVNTTLLDDQFKHQLDIETWADSPYVMISSRLINESNTPLKLSDLTCFSILGIDRDHAISISGPNGTVLHGKGRLTLAQRADGWSLRTNGTTTARGTKDDLGCWLRTARQNQSLTLIAPNFQGFGPAEPDLESRLTVSRDGAMSLLHYTPWPAGGEGRITFWDTTARTFPMVLHLGTPSESPVEIAAPVLKPPTIRLDRELLTSQGVLHEDRVTHIYDEPSVEGARYFDRSRAHRQDYPRMGRGMPPPKGEGSENPFTNSGGMLFGEVWQYISTKPGQVARAIDQARVPHGNLPDWYTPFSDQGVSTYRCGDQTLAIAMSYLRTGDRQVFEIFQDHPLQYADFSIAHPEGYCHYYCHWRADNHVYSRLGGLVTCYLMTGEPWFFEVAEQMAGHLVRDWDGNVGPRDTQTRSAYPGRGLVWLYEITGHRSYWNDAVDLAHWVMETGMQANGSMRGFANDDSRISPLYAGYTLLGLTPVYERTENRALGEKLTQCGEWLLTCQGAETEREGSGTWPRDTLIWGKANLGPGNSGATTLCAELQTFLAQKTGRQDFFYSGAAAWANLVTTTRHAGIQGGLPMQAGETHSTGTWSYTFPIYLHRLPAVAQRYQWPFVIEGNYDTDPGRPSPIVVFVAAGGRFDGKTFTQPLYVDNDRAVPIRVWTPQRPTGVTFAGARLSMRYESQTSIATVILKRHSKPGTLVMTCR